MLMTRAILQKDPGTDRKTLMRRMKRSIEEKEAEGRLEYAKSLEHQGQLMRLTEDAAAKFWASAVINLPPEVLKFSMNAAQDTLPHNSNLAYGEKRKAF